MRPLEVELPTKEKPSARIASGLLLLAAGSRRFATVASYRANKTTSCSL